MDLNSFSQISSMTVWKRHFLVYHLLKSETPGFSKTEYKIKKQKKREDKKEERRCFFFFSKNRVPDMFLSGIRLKPGNSELDD